jgi:hypothetical protein
MIISGIWRVALLRLLALRVYCLREGSQEVDEWPSDLCRGSKQAVWLTG